MVDWIKVEFGLNWIGIVLLIGMYKFDFGLDWVDVCCWLGRWYMYIWNVELEFGLVW